jgi:hypothetical protein
VTSRSAFALAAAAALCAASAAHGQASRAVSVEQLTPAGTSSQQRADRVNVAPVRGRSSSASAQEGSLRNVAPAVAPEVLEACRRAQAGDQAAPEGVDCIAALQVASQAAPIATAEGSLLEMFGQPGTVTTASTAPSVGGSTDANSVARDLSNGDVQSTGVAGIVARDRGATPPPSSPR